METKKMGHRGTVCVDLFVSIIIPMYNERVFIGNCLESVLANEYPRDRLEILVVDGMSDDSCRTIVKGLAEKHSSIRLLDNPSRTTPAALNTGIEAAKGDVIMRMDAHAIYPPDYIARSVEDLQYYGCDNVGGVLEIHPGDQSVMARAIAVAQGHPFGVGNAYYRIGVKEPKWVDTVAFGCFRKDVFDCIGLFDMDLIRNQDDEFNARLIRHGGRILLDPAIRCRYFARSTLGQVVHMFHQYGYFKPLAAKKVGRIMTVRQLIPSLFVLTLIGSGGTGLFWPPALLTSLLLVGLYLAASFGAGFKVASRHGFAVGLTLPLVFGSMHFSYGFGFLRGIFVLLGMGRLQRDVALTR
jgi:glycosyltransferase involved in cell wall biosynthesis